MHAVHVRQWNVHESILAVSAEVVSTGSVCWRTAFSTDFVTFVEKSQCTDDRDEDDCHPDKQDDCRDDRFRADLFPQFVHESGDNCRNLIACIVARTCQERVGRIAGVRQAGGGFRD